MRALFALALFSCGGELAPGPVDASAEPEAPPRCPVFRPSTCVATRETVIASTDRDVYKLAQDDGAIYWSEPGTRTIKRVSKVGGAVSQVVFLPDRPSSIAVDGERVFFRAAEDIRVVASAGGEVTLLATGVKDSSVLTLDLDRVFWPTSAGLLSAPKEGGAPVVLAPSNEPRTAPRNASRTPSDGVHVYFATYGAGVWRVPVRGGAPAQLANRRAYNLVLDCNSVYFAGEACDRGLPIGVWSVPLAGGEPKLAAKSELTDCSWQLGGLAEDEQSLYWSEHVGGQGSVWRTPKSGGASALVSRGERPVDVLVDDRCIYWLRALDVGLPTARGEIVAAPLPR